MKRGGSLKRRKPLRAKPIKRVPRETVRAFDKMLDAIEFDPPKGDEMAFVGGKPIRARMLVVFLKGWAPLGMKRKPLSKRGARSKREAPDLAKFRKAVLAKTGGACARCGSRKRVHAHHMRRRSKDPGVHDPKFGAPMCSICHRLAHDHACADWELWFVK